MTNPHNVDICVTIVSDKPPQLPLREELPSLGIECVYEAAGVGKRASEAESRKKFRKFRREHAGNKAKKIVPSRSKRGRNRQIKRGVEEKDLLRTVTALSYSEYKHCLNKMKPHTIKDSQEPNTESPTYKKESKTIHVKEGGIALRNVFDEVSPTPNELESREAQKSPCRPGRIRSDPVQSIHGLLDIDSSTRDPPTSPAPILNQAQYTENSLQEEDFPRTSMDAPGSRIQKPPKRDPSPSKNLESSGDITVSSIPKENLQVETLDNAKDKTGSIKNSEENLQVETFDNAKDKKGSIKNSGGITLSPVPKEDSQVETFDTVKGKKGTIKVKIIESDSQQTELFDLTEVSDSDSCSVAEDLSMIPSQQASSVTQEQRPILKADVPEIKDIFGRVVLDLSCIKEEENVPGSTLALYPPEKCPTSRESNDKNLTSFAMLRGLSIPDLEDMIRRNPDVSFERSPEGQYLLHDLSERYLSDKTNQSFRIQDLVRDVVNLRRLLTALKSINLKACSSFDGNGDLPVHLLARSFMAWELKWYEHIYLESGENSIDVTTLYQTMAQCIDLLLEPISSFRELCCEGGGTGQLLPLHIAAIFTASYNLLRDILEVYPEAASIPCNLEGIETFIPNASLPLELHEILSSDFPKWELKSILNQSENEVIWTQEMLDACYNTKLGMRRSDLIFAFHPNVLPFQHDASRIRRIESRISQEVEDVHNEELSDLSLPVRLSWMWLCTFHPKEDEMFDYSDSVKRVVKSLSAQKLRYLASQPTNKATAIIDEAQNNCVEAILYRLNELAKKEIMIRQDTLPADTKLKVGSSLLNTWESEIASRYFLRGKGFIAILLRTLFNIQEVEFPTSFIILPYRLVKGNDGKLGLESAKAASVAMKFADCLLHLTNPALIVWFLEKKAETRFRKATDGREKKIEDQARTITKQLLRLYENGSAYFYFLDEYSGAPIVTEENNMYPFVVNDSFDVIRKILPLMITGMILMRGDKAHSVIAGVLLSRSRLVTCRHWIEATKDLVGYLYSPKASFIKNKDLLSEREKLVQLLEEAPRSTVTTEDDSISNAWVVELSLVKMVVGMHDPDCYYAGMLPKRAGDDILWTEDYEVLEPTISDTEEVIHKKFDIDFMTPADLKGRDNQDEKTVKGQNDAACSRHPNPTISSNPAANAQSEYNSGLELLFGELSFRMPSEKETSCERNVRDKNVLKPSSFTMDKDLFVSKLQKKSIITASTSLLDFDDTLGLDEVLHLRILLDEQEAKLGFLRERINDIHEAELDLLEQEEKVGAMINEINNEKESLIESPTNKGLSKARNLLLRISELENRVLCKEVEVGQMANRITCLELQAKEDIFMEESEATDTEYGLVTTASNCESLKFE